jgi:hypothetical protein
MCDVMPIDDPWEQVRFLTADQLVTWTKLNGSAFALNGNTTPEGWPFVVVIAVAKPGNERAVELAQEFHRKLTEAGAPVRRTENPATCPGCGRVRTDLPDCAWCGRVP